MVVRACAGVPCETGCARESAVGPRGGVAQHVLDCFGDLDAQRDWGYAGDYVRAMWLIVQQDEPDDYVIASGESHSVRELVACAFERVGLDWREHVQIDESLLRGRAELHDLVGNPARARERLGWTPEVSFTELVHLLVDAELARLEPERATVG